MLYYSSLVNQSEMKQSAAHQRRCKLLITKYCHVWSTALRSPIRSKTKLEGPRDCAAYANQECSNSPTRLAQYSAFTTNLPLYLFPDYLEQWKYVVPGFPSSTPVRAQNIKLQPLVGIRAFGFPSSHLSGTICRTCFAPYSLLNYR